MSTTTKLKSTSEVTLRSTAGYAGLASITFWMVAGAPTPLYRLYQETLGLTPLEITLIGAIAHFERRLIAERTKHGIVAARARGKRPGRQPLDTDRIAAALKLVAAGLSPTAAARQLGLGRSREVGRAGIKPACDPMFPLHCH